jgi:hypothetical protein
MKSKLLAFAGVLALLAVLGKFYAVPALAQAVRAALVQNRDNPARQPFSALVGGFDIISSPAVPPGTRLIVTNMYFSVHENPDSFCGAEVIAPGHHSFYALAGSQNFPADGGEIFAADHPFQIALDPGQSIQVNLPCYDPDIGHGEGPVFFVTSEVSFSGYTIGVP